MEVRVEAGVLVMARSTARVGRLLFRVLLVALLVLVGACSGDDEQSSPKAAASASPTRTIVEGCGFSDAEVALVEEYVATFNEHDVDAIMALFSDDALAEGDDAEVLRCAHEAAFDADVFIRIDFDNCVGQFVDADGVDLTTAVAKPMELPFEVCGAYCDWTFMFTGDGRIRTNSPSTLAFVEGYTSVTYPYAECLSEGVWNAQEVDDVLALHTSGSNGTEVEQIRCLLDAARQHDTAVIVHAEDGLYRITDSDGEVVPDDPDWQRLRAFTFESIGHFDTAKLYQRDLSRWLPPELEACFDQ